MASTIGKIEGGGQLEIDIPTLLRTRMLIQANSGSGKSWVVRRILEQTAKHVQQIVLDIDDEFFTLRERFDYLICAPSGADAIANPNTATLLARNLRQFRASAVIGLYEMSPADRRKFVRLFLEELMEAPRSMWHPCLVVVSEAHHFCPEKGEAESMHAMVDLASRGRKRGLCAVMDTQRISKLHKDTAAELLNKISGRVGLDIDVRRAADDLGMPYKEATPILRNLDPGEFFAYGPALSKAVVKVQVGPVVTTHPDVGSKQVAAPPPPSARIKKILSQLKDLPQKAVEEAKTLSELKAENVNLKRSLAASVSSSVKVETPAKVTRIEVPVVGKRAVAGLQQASKEMRKALTKIKSIHEAWGFNLDLVGKKLDELGVKLEHANVVGREPYQWTIVPATVRVPDIEIKPCTALPTDRKLSPTIVTKNSSQLPRPQQKILDAIAWFESAGINEPLNVAVAFVAGYSHKGSAYGNPRSALRAAGLIEYRGDKLALLPAGRGMAYKAASPLTRTELHRHVMHILPGPEAKLLRVLLDKYPESVHEIALADQSGYSAGGSAFGNPKSRLRSLGLITYPSPKHARAADFLFQLPT